MSLYRRIVNDKTMKKTIKRILLAVLIAFVVTLFIPQTIYNPVEGCGAESYNHKTFWHPWGDHYHRGVDIFAKKGTPIHSATYGLVVATSEHVGLGGKCVLVMGTHGRLYYYAHMDEIKTHFGAVVGPDDVIGTVGNTGNAATTPSHCHFSIPTILLQFDHWPTDDENFWKMGNWQKIFFVNPVDVIDNSRKSMKSAKSVVERSYELETPYFDMSHASNVCLLSRIGMNIRTSFGNHPKACINTVTSLFDKQNTCSSCADFVEAPEKWNFKETERPRKGDIAIYFDQNNRAYHAALIAKTTNEATFINHAVKDAFLKDKRLPQGKKYKFYRYID